MTHITKLTLALALSAGFLVTSISSVNAMEDDGVPSLASCDGAVPYGSLVEQTQELEQEEDFSDLGLAKLALKAEQEKNAVLDAALVSAHNEVSEDRRAFNDCLKQRDAMIRGLNLTVAFRQNEASFLQKEREDAMLNFEITHKELERSEQDLATFDPLVIYAKILKNQGLFLSIRSTLNDVTSGAGDAFLEQFSYYFKQRTGQSLEALQSSVSDSEDENFDVEPAPSHTSTSNPEENSSSESDNEKEIGEF